MNKKISFAGPSITEKELEYVTDAVKTGWYENFDGYITKLEKAFAEYIGVRYAIATFCCTHALHLAAAAIGLQAGDEVIVTDFSWVATAYAVAYTGADCVFVDITPDTWTIDPACIRKAITRKTRAIMLVHTFGHPAEMQEIMAISREYGLFVIEDAAPAIGAEYRGRRVGSFGDISCFSFQGAKMTVSGEGGMFLTDDPEIYRRTKLLSSMGRTDSRAVFWSDYLGYEYGMSNVTAALALAQLERIEELIEKKRSLFCFYEERLGNVEGIQLIREKPGCKSNCCYPSILLEDSVSADRDDVLSGLRQKNIHARPGFPQMSRFPVFEQRFPNPVARRVEERGISLPSAANLEEEDIDFVCRALLDLTVRG